MQKTVTLEPNASEVGGFEYVTPEQLLTLMMPESGPLPLHIFAQTFAHSHPTVVITYFGWQVVCGLPGSASWPHACYCRSGLGSRQSSTGARGPTSPRSNASIAPRSSLAEREVPGGGSTSPGPRPSVTRGSARFKSAAARLLRQGL